MFILVFVLVFVVNALVVIVFIIVIGLVLYGGGDREERVMVNGGWAEGEGRWGWAGRTDWEG